MDRPVVGGCSPEVGLHPLGVPRLDAVGPKLHNTLVWGCLQLSHGEVVETHGFIDRMCLRAGKMSPACARLISKY